MRILGIETSCDETGAAVIEGNPGDKTVKLLSNIIASSLSLHAKTGGIIPEVAAREQIKYIIPVIEQALKDTKLSALSSPPLIDSIAVTIGPGLIGSLLVGVETAKTLAYVWNKPIIPVNHLIGHIYANFIGEISNLKSPFGPSSGRGQISNQQIIFPAIALMVSGGHTDLVLMKGHQQIKWIGGTRDDAAGEAFDKIGRLLGLPYPGGPAIASLAEKGDPKAFNFPRPMIDSDDFDFSFSGLKTAVYNFLRHSGKRSQVPDGTWRSASRIPTGSWASQDDKWLYDICASSQQAIVDVLVNKTLKAAQKYKVKSIILSGGVAANEKLREQFISNLTTHNSLLKTRFFAPAKSLCTDNAAMITTAAFFNYKPLPWQKITANPSLHF